VIDLHAHVLPGIDDGPPDMAGTLALLEAAAAAGTRVIAATPHLRSDFPAVDVRRIAHSCRVVQNDVPAAWDLRIVAGAEIDVLWAVTATREELRHASFDQRGTDLLVETPYTPQTMAFEETIFELAVQGYRVLLAHPEANPTLQARPGRLEALVERGVLLQITGASLIADPRRSPRARLARWLVKQSLAHVIASDSHSGGGWRPPSVAAAVTAARKLNPSRAGWMVTAAPAAILVGKPLPPPPRAR